MPNYQFFAEYQNKKVCLPYFFYKYFNIEKGEETELETFPPSRITKNEV